MNELGDTRRDEGVRVGVIGCGYWGPKHLRVLSGLPTVSSVAAIDARPERLDDVRRRLPSVRCFTSLQDALPHVDALVVATPPSSHFPLAMRALDAGKHVLLEKPMAPSSVDCAVLDRRARDNDLVLMVGHTFEYNSAVVKLREIVQSGTIGDLYYFDSARLNLGLYQQDVSVLFDLAPHDVSIANYVLNACPTTVEAWASKHAHHQHSDVAYLRLSYGDRGVCANIHVSWLDPCKVRRVTVVGSRQMVVYNDLKSDEPIRIYDKGVVAAPVVENAGQPPMSYRYGDIVAPFTAGEEPLEVQDEHFVECILTGKTPQSDAAVGMAVVRVLEAAQLSIERGGRVHLEEIEAWSPERRVFAGPGSRGASAVRKRPAVGAAVGARP